MLPEQGIAFLKNSAIITCFDMLFFDKQNIWPQLKSCVRDTDKMALQGVVHLYTSSQRKRNRKG